MTEAATVGAHTVVTCGATLAERRLVSALAAMGASSQDPDANGFRLSVGPHHPHLLRSSVTAHLSPPAHLGRSQVCRLSWQPTGKLAARCPALDGRVIITSINATTALLTIAGSYRPPLGRIALPVDRAVMHRVAESTVRQLTNRLGRALSAGPLDPPEESS